MDRQKSPTSITHAPYLPPAQLWVGPHDSLLEETYRYLQKLLCKHGGCYACAICNQIMQQQHHAVCWLYPEKQYTLDQLKTISSTLAFSLDPDTLFFFIIQKANALTAACSNQLLKSIEEPPRGYHFILLADKADDIIPTIRSRCIIQTWYMQNSTTQHQPIIDCFTKKNTVPPATFASVIETSKITEHETKEVVEALMAHWGQQYKKAVLKNNDTATHLALHVIERLKQAIVMPPMPGSSKLFWKNLFLQIYG